MCISTVQFKCLQAWPLSEICPSSEQFYTEGLKLHKVPHGQQFPSLQFSHIHNVFPFALDLYPLDISLILGSLVVSAPCRQVIFNRWPPGVRIIPNIYVIPHNSERAFSYYISFLIDLMIITHIEVAKKETFERLPESCGH
jgi:hypothetical protein